MKYFNIFVIVFAMCFLLGSAQEKSAEEICRQPLLRGRCRALIPRFYYNIAKQQCEAFKFGGCGGNDNNFATQEDCENLCTGITAA